MNSPFAFRENIENNLQVYAAKGLLSCQHYEKVYVDDLIHLVVLNMLLTLATILSCLSYSFNITRLATSIFLTKCTLSLTAIIIGLIFYRVLFLKIDKAKLWKPLFEHILSENYPLALETLEKITIIQKNARTSFKILDPLSFNDGLDQEIKIDYLKVSLTALRTLNEITNIGIKDEEEITELLKNLDKISTATTSTLTEKCKYHILLFNKPNSSLFIPQKINLPIHDLLLKNFIKTILKIENSHEIFNIAKPIRYLRELRSFYREKNQSFGVHYTYISSLIKAKTFSDLFQQIKKYPGIELLLEHLSSPIFSNKIFYFEKDKKTYSIRFICNPQQKTLTFAHKGLELENFCTNDSYVIACNEVLPHCIQKRLRSILLLFEMKEYSHLNLVINNIFPLDYTASPLIN